MQYGVPQFIDVEDKIVGPFTAKQTLYLMIGGGLLILVFSFFTMGFFVMSILIIVPLTLLFAFYKPKGITVAQYLANFMKYHSSNHLYVWRREDEGSIFKAVQKKKAAAIGGEAKTVSRSKIRELAWVLDTSTQMSASYEAKERPEEEVRR